MIEVKQIEPNAAGFSRAVVLNGTKPVYMAVVDPCMAADADAEAMRQCEAVRDVIRATATWLVEGTKR